MQAELRDQANGKWSGIYSSYGFDERLLRRKHMPCPICGGADRFRYLGYGDGRVICNQCMPAPGKDGIDFLMLHTGLGFKQLADEIRQSIGEIKVDAISKKTDFDKNKNSLNRTWEECELIKQSDPVHRYLHSRALPAPSSRDVKTHQSLTYYDTSGDDVKVIGRFPAMIGVVKRPDGIPATLHCTYLTRAGVKVDLSPCRKVKPPSKSWAGGAVRLSDNLSGDTLVVGEGIESTLAYMALNSLPGWAALTAGNLEKFKPPKVQRVIIAADNDNNYTGQQAAYSLAKRLSREGYSVHVDMPDAGDWADVWMNKYIDHNSGAIAQ